MSTPVTPPAAPAAPSAPAGAGPADVGPADVGPADAGPAGPGFTEAPGATRWEPEWTIGRLTFVLALLFGVNRRGGPNTAAAAAALGVHQRSVQRWLRTGGAPPAQAPAPIPAARLQQVRHLVLPDPQTLAQEDQGARYAREALARIALPRGAGVLPAWRERRWLDQHLVAVLDLPDLGLRQVTVSRVDAQVLPELRRRGQVVDFTTVATRFHATTLAHEVLTVVAPWRLQAPPALVRQGRTQTWTADAPAVDVTALAVAAGLR